MKQKGKGITTSRFLRALPWCTQNILGKLGSPIVPRTPFSDVESSWEEGKGGDPRDPGPSFHGAAGFLFFVVVVVILPTSFLKPFPRQPDVCGA